MAGTRGLKKAGCRYSDDRIIGVEKDCGWAAPIIWKICCREKAASKMRQLHCDECAPIVEYNRQRQHLEAPKVRYADQSNSGYVYIVAIPDSRGGVVYKVGRSKNPKSRIRALSATHVEGVRLFSLRSANDCVEAEGLWHERFSSARCDNRKELFELTREMADEFRNENVNGQRGKLLAPGDIMELGFDDYAPMKHR